MIIANELTSPRATNSTSHHLYSVSSSLCSLDRLWFAQCQSVMCYAVALCGLVWVLFLDRKASAVFIRAAFFTSFDRRIGAEGCFLVFSFHWNKNKNCQWPEQILATWTCSEGFAMKITSHWCGVICMDVDRVILILIGIKDCWFQLMLISWQALVWKHSLQTCIACTI